MRASRIGALLVSAGLGTAVAGLSTGGCAGEVGAGRCSEERPCPSGYLCQDGLCRLESQPQEDAGPEPDAACVDDGGASAPDVGSGDDSSWDAALAGDSGPNQAPDAGQPKPDAGPPPDAGECGGFAAPVCARPNCGPEPLTVSFDGDCAIQLTGLNASWLEWDFGDGTGTTTETSPRHTYYQAGEYTAKASIHSYIDGTELTVRLKMAIRLYAP